MLMVKLLSRGGYIGLHTVDLTVAFPAVVEGTGYCIKGSDFLAAGACKIAIKPDMMYHFYPKEIKIVEDNE